MMWSAGSKTTKKSKLHQFVPVSLIKECVVGTSAFTLGRGGGIHRPPSTVRALASCISLDSKGGT